MRRQSALQDESGSALVAAVVVMLIATLLGMVALQVANVQTRQTGYERGGEEAFNVAESVLNAEVSLLQNAWPSSASAAYPVCTQTSTPGSTCPQAALATGFSASQAGTDFGAATWNVQVIDDNVSGTADQSYYSDGILTSSQLAHWDSNDDNRVWVRADATAGGQRRIVVAQVLRQQNVVSLPQSVVASGSLQTSNNGNKIIVQATDPNSGLTGPVDLRCSFPSGQTAPEYGSSCAGWDASKNNDQVSPPDAYQTSYVGTSGSYSTLSSSTLSSLMASAQSSNTYYDGTCPPLGQTGVLFIENTPAGGCTYTGSGTTNWNSDSAPGAIVVINGTLNFDANINFYGIIYMANAQGSVPSSGPCTSAQQDTVFTVSGGGSLHGGLFVDNCGLVSAGDKAYDIQYDVKAFGGLQTFATPSLAQNTFRILPNP